MSSEASRKVFTEQEAAPYLGFKPSTLRQSRCTGVLAGISAPKHVKLGRSVRYRQSDLDAWVDQAAKEVSA